MKKAKDVEANFATVRAIVRSAGCDSTILKAVDHLTSAALILSPLVLGPAAVPLLALFDMKADLIRSAHDAARAMAGVRTDFLTRSRSLAAAHAMITYSAFFEAMDRDLGAFLKKLELTADDRRLVIQRAVDLNPRLRRPDNDADVAQPIDYNALAPVSLPHPAATFATEADDRRAFYQQMTRLLSLVLVNLDGYKRLDPASVKSVEDILPELPATAVELYFAQYLELMLEFKDFFGWASLYEAQKTQQLVGDLATDVADEALLARKAIEGVDIGLESLRQAVRQLSASMPVRPGADSDTVVDDLAVVYQGVIAERIIMDTYDEANDAPAIQYPTRAQAFVPQAYKATEYTTTKVNLEDEATWAHLPERDDLGVFLAKYFTSPYSAQSPLLVLGHPGSGKSLLTQLIAARLMPPAFNAIRIELRDIEPDSDIQSQIEDQIRADTGHEVNWVEFSTGLTGNPPLIILDGYDELLQSTGKVFAGYLDRVHRFQTREAMLKRPVRVMITSRITLIDKAVIPVGTSVLRLLEFDEARRHEWTAVWNGANATYFRRAGIEPFEVPPQPQLLELARQPLLLLMLALYDSRDNELRESRLDQTMLYNSLLRRFIARERNKGEGGAAFRLLGQAEQDAIVDDDMNRLGVAAIGMFNRKALHTHRAELDLDIEYFGAERQVQVSSGSALTQADLLLGSFFFIHESRSRSGDPDDRTGGKFAAFEFLHNTFGEFLTADFIVRQILKQTEVILALQHSEVLRPNLDAQLGKPPDHWFAALAFTALHTRPVVLEMVREWLPHRAERAGFARQDAAGCLHLVVTRQLSDALTGTPAAWLSAGIHETKFERFAYLGHLAVYTFNLVALAAVAAEAGYAFRLPPESGRPADSETSWDVLFHLWRSWFGLDGLAGAAAVIRAVPQPGGGMLILAKEAFGMPPSGSMLGVMRNVSAAMGDQTAEALIALTIADKSGLPVEELDALGGALATIQVDADEVLAPRISKAGHGSPVTPGGWVERQAKRFGRQAPPSPFPLSAMAANEFLRAEHLSEAAFEASSDLGPDSMYWLASLSEYEAGLVIENRALLEPRWLHDLVNSIGGIKGEARERLDHVLAPIFYYQRRIQPATRADDVFRGLVGADALDRMACRTLVEVLLFLHDNGAATHAISAVDRRLAERLVNWEDLRHVPEDSMIDLIHLAAANGSPATRRRLADVASEALGHSFGAHDNVYFPLFLTAFSFEELAVDLVNPGPILAYAVNQVVNRRSCLLALIRSAALRADADFACRVLSAVLRYYGSPWSERLLGQSLVELLALDKAGSLERLYTVEQGRDIQWLLSAADLIDGQ